MSLTALPIRDRRATSMRKRLAVAALTLLAAGATHAQTYNSIFPAGWDDSLRHRFFMRVGYVGLITRTKSGAVYDVTGPVVQTSQLQTIASGGYDSQIATITAQNPYLSPSNFDGRGNGLSWDVIALTLLNNGLSSTSGLGTPPGITARAADSQTLAVSAGYWLDDDATFAVEAYLLAAPLTVSAYGAGTNATGHPNGVSGAKVLTSRLLPPLAILSYSFGDKSSFLRPYVGVGGTYAIFYDTKVTQAFQNYIGGGTTIAGLKNAFGVGPFLGLKGDIDGSWQVNMSVGEIDLHTQATLTTYNSVVNSNAGVLKDYSSSIMTAINFGNSRIDSNLSGKLTQLLDAINGNSTFVRKQNTQFDNTIFNLSIGRSF